MSRKRSFIVRMLERIGSNHALTRVVDERISAHRQEKLGLELEVTQLERKVRLLAPAYLAGLDVAQSESRSA